VTAPPGPPPPRRIVFLGPPGAGKGTQASELAREVGIAHLSTGDLLRAAVAEGSELGRAADGHIRAGRLVPDELVLEILRERLHRSDAAAGFILDGYPRTLTQAETLERLTPLDAVVSFEVDPGTLVERLAGRRYCPGCGSVYNVALRPPRQPGRCDRDGTELLQRPDDRPEAVAVRLRVYAEQTAPLLEHYRRLGLLRPLDASGTANEVAGRLRRLLASAPVSRPVHNSPPGRPGRPP
jgi:adenylate kinase